MGKIDISWKSFEVCSAMLLFSHILIMRVQPSTLISMKKEKENTINATEMHSLLPKLRKNPSYNWKGV